MTPFNRCLAGISILLSAATPGFAHNRTNPRADRAVSTERDRLVVTQDAGAFSIVRPAGATADHGEPATKAPIALGTAHRIDRSIFTLVSKPAGEKLDARR